MWVKDWLVEQLKDKYGVRQDIGKQWVINQKIIPLLDGLDELAAERQEKCVIKINEFIHPSNWNNPVVICSRIQEYERYKTLLQLNNSLELSPFSHQQVSQYLENIGHSKGASQFGKNKRRNTIRESSSRIVFGDQSCVSSDSCSVPELISSKQLSRV